MAQRVSQLAAYMDLILGQPRTLQSLRAATVGLHDGAGLAGVLPNALQGALSLIGAEAGNIQILEPSDDSLVLVTQFGFGRDYLDHFAVVDHDDSVCGRAAAQCAQAVVADVQDDPAFTPHRSVFRAAGVRAVQSTPLLDRTGQIIGMLSTTRPQSGRPPDRLLQSMRFYGQLVGEVIAGYLGRRRPDYPRNPAYTAPVLAPPELAIVQLSPVVLPAQAHTVGIIRAQLVDSALRMRAFADELQQLVPADKPHTAGGPEEFALALVSVCRTLAKNWCDATPITDERVREFNREIEFLGFVFGVPTSCPRDGARPTDTES